MDKLANLLKDYDEDEEEDIEVEYDEEEDEDAEPFIIRLTKSYNFIVDAIEYMPPSTSKELKFKKDKDTLRRFYVQLSGIAKDYQDFLNRIKKVIAGS